MNKAITKDYVYMQFFNFITVSVPNSLQLSHLSQGLKNMIFGRQQGHLDVSYPFLFKGFFQKINVILFNVIAIQLVLSAKGFFAYSYETYL
jgi:hypothetical protein